MWKMITMLSIFHYDNHENREMGFIGWMQYLIFSILVVLHLLCLCSAFVKNTTLPCVKALSHYCQELSHLNAVFLCNLSSPEKTLPFNVGWIFLPDGQRLAGSGEVQRDICMCPSPGKQLLPMWNVALWAFRDPSTQMSMNKTPQPWESPSVISSTGGCVFLHSAILSDSILVNERTIIIVIY